MTDHSLSGAMLIGAQAVYGAQTSFRAINPATGLELEPVFGGGGKGEVDRACNLAWAAFDSYRETSNEARATFLETIASEILALGDALIERAVAESGLPRGRIEGERGRTMGQLQMFAALVREGSFVDARIDPALPDRKPLPRVDIRQRHIALGPVGVFGASNFPLAFSVAGGDTASALAAGCPVVVKAHSAHPGTSELVGRAIQAAIAKCGLPEGVFSMLFGAGTDVGTALVEHPHIKAIGFTGSRMGGLALMKAAALRPEPIPVYAEMSSINPVLLMPAALKARAVHMARDFVGSLTLGAGQFCTNPGLLLAVDGPDLDAFLEAAASVLSASAPATMLTPNICRAYTGGVARLAAYAGVKQVAQGLAPNGPNQGQGALFVTDAAAFAANAHLGDEIFGAAALVIRCPDVAAMRALAEKLEGQLTATVQMDAADTALVRTLLPTLERRVGRILINGYPTGVEVNDAMVHGGPFPATSDARSTSVGTLAIQRFLRPVAYQNFPDELLPAALQDANPSHLWRRRNSQFGRD
ncbi:MAG: aldehyde dehydrogenase (NADP(+)) [Hyphomicrobiales bacterium]|nr:aldehyde dehydrogenase (NADP(+)) [Hyphomicrobiales bacterium]MDE2113564.1 aldehyde dehydrogenase (NADP(+)) [Hyphomicrobiales bacterium]